MLSSVNWSDLKSKVSKYFTVHEATYLPSWNTHHNPSDVEKANILRMAAQMDLVRELLGPISVHVWIRPTTANCPSSPHHGQDYNALIGGAKRSSHITGLAVDWHASAKTCDEARAALLPKLAEFGLCMEDLPGSNWVHTDVAPPRGGTTRFFKP